MKDGWWLVKKWRCHTKLTSSGQDGLLAERELGDTLVPALDDLADADGALEGRAAVTRRVELGAVGEGTNVSLSAKSYLRKLTVDGDLVALLGEGLAVSGLDNLTVRYALVAKACRPPNSPLEVRDEGGGAQRLAPFGTQPGRHSRQQ